MPRSSKPFIYRHILDVVKRLCFIFCVVKGSQIQYSASRVFVAVPQRNSKMTSSTSNGANRSAQYSQGKIGGFAGVQQGRTRTSSVRTRAQKRKESSSVRLIFI